MSGMNADLSKVFVWADVHVYEVCCVKVKKDSRHKLLNDHKLAGVSRVEPNAGQLPRRGAAASVIQKLTILLLSQPHPSFSTRSARVSGLHYRHSFSASYHHSFPYRYFIPISVLAIQTVPPISTYIPETS